MLSKRSCHTPIYRFEQTQSPIRNAIYNHGWIHTRLPHICCSASVRATLQRAIVSKMRIERATKRALEPQVAEHQRYIAYRDKCLIEDAKRSHSIRFSPGRFQKQSEMSAQYDPQRANERWQHQRTLQNLRLKLEIRSLSAGE